jgi:hypothetical protein
VKFRSDVAGSVSAIRFYKGSRNTGTHTGSLWTATGALLATGTFSGESASGWQQLTFSAPVPIDANTTYVASYYAPTGHYAFGVSTPASGPLRVLNNGANGVYHYGASGFPNTSGAAANYWVDVVFSDGTSDDAAPAVLSGGLPAALLLGALVAALAFLAWRRQAHRVRVAARPTGREPEA